MNKTLALMINSIEPKENKERAHVLADGLLAMRDCLKNTNIDFNEQVNFDKLYDDVRNSMSIQNGRLLHQLDPVHNGFRGSYDVRGSDFTLCFWMYLVAEIVEQDPSDIEAWRRFGRKMNAYMYDLDTYMRHMVETTARVDMFPIAKLMSNFAIYNNVSQPKVMASILQSDTLLNVLVSMSSQDSLSRILSRMNYMMTIEKDTWVEIGKIFTRLDKAFQTCGVQAEYEVRQLRRSLLFSGNMEDVYTYIKRNLNGILSEIQEADEDMHQPEDVAKSVIIDFIKRSDPGLAHIFNSQFDPTTISLPLNDLEMKLLLLTKKSLSDSRPSFYDGYYNAQSIYIGKPDPGYDLAMDYRIKLQKELMALAIAGYTGVLVEEGLTFPV